MKTIKTTGGLKINTGLKAGGLSTWNHNRGGLAVKASVRAGGLSSINHSRCALSVR